MESNTGKRRILILHPDLKTHSRYAGNSDAVLLFEPRAFNGLVDSLRRDYSDFVDGISLKYRDNIDWWVTSVASRDTVQSKAYLNLAYLLYLGSLLSNGTQIDVIVCGSRGLKRSIDSLLRDRRISGIEIDLVRDRGLRNMIKRSLLVHLVRVVKFVLDTFRKELSARASRAEGRRPDFKHPLLLADIFILDGTFKGDRFEDRYYNDFPDALAEMNFAYLPTLCITKEYRSVFSKMRSSKHPFLIKEDFLTAGDYLWTMLHVVRGALLPKYYHKFRDLDVYPIFNEDFLENLSTSSFEALLGFRLIKRLRERKVRIGLLLDWFENQNVDKSLNLAIHKFHPETRSLGYQAFNVSSNYLCVQPTAVEQNAGVIPDIVAVSGKAKTNYLKELNSNLEVVVAPAFRFKHVWKANETRKGGDLSVQVSLPMMLPDSLEILKVLRSIRARLPSSIKFAVKIHPVTDRKKVESFLSSNQMDTIPVWTDSFEECLKRTSVLVSSTSSVIMEAITKGVPAIVIGSQSQITHNPIPPGLDQKMWALCYTADEVAEKIRFYSGLDDESRAGLAKIGEKIKEEYFEPVTAESVSGFTSLLQRMMLN